MVPPRHNIVNAINALQSLVPAWVFRALTGYVVNQHVPAGQQTWNDVPPISAVSRLLQQLADLPDTTARDARLSGFLNTIRESASSLFTVYDRFIREIRRSGDSPTGGDSELIDDLSAQIPRLAESLNQVVYDLLTETQDANQGSSDSFLHQLLLPFAAINPSITAQELAERISSGEGQSVTSSQSTAPALQQVSQTRLETGTAPEQFGKGRPATPSAVTSTDSRNSELTKFGVPATEEARRDWGYGRFQRGESARTGKFYPRYSVPPETQGETSGEGVTAGEVQFRSTLGEDHISSRTRRHTNAQRITGEEGVVNRPPSRTRRPSESSPRNKLNSDVNTPNAAEPSKGNKPTAGVHSARTEGRNGPSRDHNKIVTKPQDNNQTTNIMDQTNGEGPVSTDNEGSESSGPSSSSGSFARPSSRSRPAPPRLERGPPAKSTESLGTTSHTMARDTYGCFQPPNIHPARQPGHVGPFPDESSFKLIGEMTDYLASKEVGAAGYVQTTAIAVAANAFPPTYKFGAMNLRADITNQPSSDTWTLAGVNTGILGVTITGATKADSDNILLVAAASVLPTTLRSDIKSIPIHIRDEFTQFLPPGNPDPDRFYYMSETSRRMAGRYSESVLARAIANAVNERLQGSLVPMMVRLVSYLWWFHMPRLNDFDYSLGEIRTAMKPVTGTAYMGRYRFNSVFTPSTTVAGPFTTTRQTACLFYGNNADQVAKEAVDVAAITHNRFVRSDFGDGSVKLYGADPATPAGWDQNNTCVIPLRKGDVAMQEVNNFWLMAHFGASLTSFADSLTWFSDNVNDQARSDGWRLHESGLSCALSSIDWAESTIYKHILFVLIDTDTGGDIITIANGTQITVAGTTGAVTVTNGILTSLGNGFSEEYISADRTDVVTATMQRFDEVYAPVHEEIKECWEFIIRYGYRAPELPKIQDEQGQGNFILTSSVINFYASTELSGTVVSNRSWASGNFCINHVPLHEDTVYASWAGKVLTLDRHAHKTKRPIPLGENVVYLNMAGYYKKSENDMWYVRNGVVGGVGYSPPLPIYLLARAMGVARPEGPFTRLVKADWLAAGAGVARHAADIISYHVDDLLARSSATNRLSERWLASATMRYEYMSMLAPEVKMKLNYLFNFNDFKADIWATGYSQNWTRLLNGIDPTLMRTGATGTLSTAINVIFNTWIDEMDKMALPKRVPDEVLYLETNGVLREHITELINKSAVDWTLSGSLWQTTLVPPGAPHPTAMSRLTPAQFLSNDRRSATIGDLRIASRLQNSSVVIRRITFFMGERNYAQPTPFRPIGCISPFAPTNDPSKQFESVLVPGASVVVGIYMSSSNAMVDVRDSTRVLLRILPYRWEDMLVRVSTDLGRLYNGINPAMPLVYVQVGEQTSMPLFEQENIGLWDPIKLMGETGEIMN